MSGFDPFFRSAAGVRHYWRNNDDGTFTLSSHQDVDDILDHNKAQATHNDGYSPDRTLRRVASIPLALVLKWKQEEGWDAFDPACADKLRQKLNDISYRHLRTAPGQL